MFQYFKKNHIMTKKDDTSQIDKDLEKILEEAEKEAAEKDATEKEEITSNEQLKDMEDKMKRAQAELVNFRQRMEKEKADFVKYAAKNTLQELLPVLDHLTLALQHIPEELKENNWVVGITHIEKQFLSALENIGVQKIKTVGEKINYDMHEAIAEKEGEKGIITKEIMPGYVLHGMVLRAAKVEVGKG